MGFEIARWLVQRGAAHLVLVGRSQPSVQVRAGIAELERSGAVVRAASVDIADEGELARLLRDVAEAMPPLRGIFHAAGIAGGRSEDVDADTFRAILRPKVTGTLLLDRLTAGLDLDFFVCFSSIASLWGSKGQAAYAAANHVLDCFAHDRRTRGLPALTINWGPWSGGGQAAREGRELLERMGIATLTPRQTLATLSRLLGSGLPQAAVVKLDWSVFKELFDGRSQGSLFERISTPERDRNNAAPADAPLVESLLRAGAGRRRFLVGHLQQEVAGILGFPEGRLPDPRQGFFQLGMDSLMAMDLRKHLVRDLGRDLPAALVFDFATAEDLAGALLEIMGAEPIAAPEAPQRQEVQGQTGNPSPLPAWRAGSPAAPIRSNSGACWSRGGTPSAACRPTAGTRMPFMIPRAGIPEPLIHGKVVSSMGSISSMPDISGFLRAKRPTWTRSTGCCWKCAMRRWRMRDIRSSQGPEEDGVFVGLTNNEYAHMLLGDGSPERIGTYYVTGNSLNAAAGRVSYALGLGGPAMAVDTACSSSLVAVHLACRSLWDRECGEAIAAGVNLILTPGSMVAACQAHMLSVDGRCKTFDAGADGYGRGEGCGAVVLKRLSDAQAAGDRVLALIRGSAVNQDGRSGGFTVPNGLSQQVVFVKPWSGRRPAGRSRVCRGPWDRHGAGRSDRGRGAGGRVREGRATGGRCRRVGQGQHRPSGIGGGHRRADQDGAGAPARRDTLPAEPADAQSGNRLGLAGIRAVAAAHAMARRGGASRASAGSAWRDQRPCRAGGGSGRRRCPLALHLERPLHLLTVSANSPQALRQLAGDMAAHLEAHSGLDVADVCFTANGRSGHALPGGAGGGIHWGRLRRTARSGGGVDGGRQAPAEDRVRVQRRSASARAGMGRVLYETQPVFRDLFDQQVALRLRPLAEVMFGEDDAWLNDPAWTWPATFALTSAGRSFGRRGALCPTAAGGRMSTWKMGRPAPPAADLGGEPCGALPSRRTGKAAT